MRNKKKIGILTWHYYNNFGSILQASAVNYIFPNSEIIDFTPYNSQKRLSYVFKSIVKLIISSTIGVFNTRRRYSFDVFKFKYLKISKKHYTRNDVSKAAMIYDIIVCGSDQIWAPNVFDPLYFAGFTCGSKIQKISYAASIGLSYLPDNLVFEYKELLKDFDAVSVREIKGKELLESCCGLSNVKVVLDPTLMVDVDIYKKRERNVKLKRKFLFCYFLNKNHNYEKVVKEYASKNNLEIIGWSAKSDDRKWLGEYGWIGPSEFLWLIHHANIVFTDSYHGTIFSLLYHKPFYVFERFSIEDPINQNSRIFQLDKWFSIGKRIIKEPYCAFDNCEYDFEYFEKQLKEARKVSLKYIKEAIRQ